MGLFNLFWDNVSQYLMALIIEAHYLSLIVYWTCFLREGASMSVQFIVL